MSTLRTSLRSFLIRAKSGLQTATQQHRDIVIVLGNESADLDSLTSSLLYAYIRSQTTSPPSSPPPSPQVPTLHIPVLNIPRSDLSLRPEFAALLPHADIDLSYLITLSDLPSLPETLTFVLVDHNAPSGPLRKLCTSKTVVGVLDHHSDENFVSSHANPRIIEKAGSCSSLVANHLRPAWDEVSLFSPSSGTAHGQGDGVTVGADDEASVTPIWDAQVAKLALASILIDTHDLHDESKTTSHDIEAVEFLESKIAAAAAPAAMIMHAGAQEEGLGSQGREWDRTAFFKQIDDAKKDIGGLALVDILRKDYKQWEAAGGKVGISSVVKPLSFLRSKASDEAEGLRERSGIASEKDAFSKATASFGSERKLSLYAIMTHFTSSDGEYKRELQVTTFDAQGTEALKKFEKDVAEELDLKEHPESGKELGIPEEGEGWVKVWLQGNVAASRKRVAPLLRQAMG